MIGAAGGGMAALGGIMAGFGTSMLSGEAGKRRKAIAALANFPDLNLDAEQIAAIQGNKAALPKAQELASQVNVFNREELLKQLRATIPGYDAILGQQSGLVQQQLAGEIPKDVASQVSRRASERNLFRGLGGSQLGRNIEARDLGLTSLDITQRGFANALNFLQGTKALTAAPMFDVTTMFQTPAQRVQQKNYEQQLRLNLNLQALGLPTGNEVWGQQLQSTGNGMAGIGTGMMSGGFGGGGGGVSGASLTLPSSATFGSGSTMSAGASTYGGADWTRTPLGIGR